MEKVLRKHGRDIAEMQYTQKRIAEMAIDLYAIAACLSRTTRAIERRGEDGARREIDLTAIFAAAAQKRLAAERRTTSTSNDDELRKAIASKHLRRRGLSARRGLSFFAFVLGLARAPLLSASLPPTHISRRRRLPNAGAACVNCLCISSLSLIIFYVS